MIKTPPILFSFLKTLLKVLTASWYLLKAWWWVLVVFVLWKPFLFFYLWWRREIWDSKIKRVVLEIRIPKESLRPIKAMESVFSSFHAIHDVMGWREYWIEGVYQLGFSCEIASIEGVVHFYIRTPKQFQGFIESTIYGQYPDVEITEVADYTKNVPQDIPNKDWDVWGMDLINTKPDCYPIKTYKKFESEMQTKEEKRIDPLAGLLEGLTTLGSGEQMWIQIIIKPIREEKPWMQEGLKIRNEIVGRVEKPKPVRKPLVQEAVEGILFGPGKSSEAQEGKEELIPPAMGLTPGEKEIAAAVEEKISKFGFDCAIRYVYVGKREVFYKPRVKIPFGFFKDLSTEALGGFKPDKHTITKVKSPFFWFLDKRRLYLRKRKMFKNYVRRWTPYFPLSGGTFVLNTEELATIFHFPSQTVVPAPALPRIESKKAGPPFGLPAED